MTPILRTERLQPSELQALFGEEKDYSCSLNDIVHHTEVCELQSDLRSLSDVDCGKPCAAPHLQGPTFSQQEYYTKLEELKREHLRNIAELEKLYLSRIKPGQRERQLITCWRQNGEDTESEQVELIQVGSKASVGRLKNGVSHLKLKARQNFLEDQRKLSHSQQNSSHSAAIQGMDNLRQTSKVTVPKPFHMMLREEDRKRRNLKTCSEMELENERLKKELDELKECSKKFLAKPAPASTHLRFYDIINKRPKKIQLQKNQINQMDHGHHGNHHKQGSQRQTPPLPQQPFSFIERERKKREKKLADELNNLTPKAERRVFKARPVPRSLYRPSSPTCQIYEAVNLNHIGSALPPSILEDTLQEGEEAENEYDDEFSRPQSTDISRCGSKLRKWKNKGALQVEEEMERKRNRERDRDWSYIHPLRRTSLCHSQEPLNTCKSDYTSAFKY
ncbi:protein FAM161A-like [Sinocyclocheilus rhinocerous]|uniref:protein FAM161A-like n=1 Tax=Sinocyclocheilus rhinocerous TaxID=307959 RepID=UPI0007B95BD3|nr:PREDICTED: protein FAM161A-like [Sinocyclocheilus rhinocerous]